MVQQSAEARLAGLQAHRRRPQARNTLIYLVRHGETVWNQAGRQQGQLDSPLTANGVEQARAAGRFLQRILPDELDVVLETSPLGRARATAELIAVELGIADRNIRSSPLLMEHALGAWEGLTYVEIDDRFPGVRQAREADKWRYVIAGGESYALASERAKRWLAGCAAALTVAVTHEMMSRAIQGAYASLSPAETLARSHPQDRLYRLDGGAITEMVIA
ncbi:MAG TPA: histidine phosphatase family protein [Reyranella sp.]|nr:histidine phosphatase family protein [Reyranella sp.]